MSDTLSLPEALLLLCLNDETGQVDHPWVDYGTSGAVLAELLLRSRIQVDAEDTVSISDPTPVGDDALDEALARIANTSPHRTFHWAAARLAARDVLIERLIKRGVLRTEEGRLLWIFPRTVHPTDNPTLEQEIRAHLKAALNGVGEVEPRVAILAALLDGMHALPHVLPGEHLAAYGDRIQALCSAEWVGRVGRAAVERAIKAVRASGAAAAAVVTSSG